MYISYWREPPEGGRGLLVCRGLLVSYPRGCRPAHPLGSAAPLPRDWLPRILRRHDRHPRRPAHQPRRPQSRGPVVRRPHAALENMVKRQVHDGLCWPDVPPERQLRVGAPTARRDAPGRGILHVAEAAPAALWLTEVLARAALREPLLTTAGASQVARLAREAAQTGGAQPCEPPIRFVRRARPARDRVAGLLVDQDRGPVGRSPPEGHRLVRDPSAGRHVPVSHLGVVVRLAVARWWWAEGLAEVLAAPALAEGGGPAAGGPAELRLVQAARAAHEARAEKGKRRATPEAGGLF